MTTAGSPWGVWDLQVQTIIDDGYIELSKYSSALKVKHPEQWAAFVDQVGT